MGREPGPAGSRAGVKGVAVRLFAALANAAYAVFKLFPVRNKVVFITWNSDAPSLDFRILMERLRALPDPPAVVALCRQLRRTPGGYVRYALHMVHQAYAMATAEVVVLDAYCLLAGVLHHRPTLRVVQIWHALGAFKKFGWSVVDKAEGWAEQSDMPPRTLAGLLRMHAGYTTVTVSYSGGIPYYAEAFNCDPGIVRVAWLPRADVLRDEAYQGALRARILAAHPELAGGKVALYAPTLRRTSGDADRVRALAQAVEAVGWRLIVKAHAVRGEDTAGDSVGLDVPDVSAFDLLAVADAVITDYSAIAYEAYLRTLPVYFYAYDMAVYEQARGFYTPVDEFPSKVYEAADDLARTMATEPVDRAAIQAYVKVFLEDSPARVDILDLVRP